MPDWCIAAGFVRNLIWDKLHGYENATPLTDIDLIYFDPEANISDKELEHKLREQMDLPWSVKNQAKMHIKNKDNPYQSSSDAMSYWVEIQAAIAVTLIDGKYEIIAPFGLEDFFNRTITLNQKRPKPEEFQKRVSGKRWLEIWPELKVL